MDKVRGESRHNGNCPHELCARAYLSWSMGVLDCCGAAALPHSWLDRYCPYLQDVAVAASKQALGSCAVGQKGEQALALMLR